jgi:pyruvate dehydrogenase E2 component (dihydrolipoamide acetyltransferase)
VRNADGKTLGAIARELRDLTDRARRGQLSPAEYSGGTFTVSNLGMFDVSSLYAIVNPPQSCILGVGAVRRTPVVRNEAVVPGEVATLTLSADHRALDGAIGGEFLRELKSLIEEPVPLFD